MTTKEELAALLSGRPYPHEITRQEAAEAYKAGLVAVYGGSDDLIYFSGAIADELGAGEESEFYLDEHGVLEGYESPEEWLESFRFGSPTWEDVEVFAERRKKARKITTHWNRDGYSWTYETDIPHATFEIMDEGDKYCRGIVFSIGDL